MQEEPGQVDEDIERRISGAVDADIQRYAAFLDRVCEISGLHRDEAATAAAIILCVFEQRISDGEIRRLEDELPGRLRALLSVCAKHPGKPPMRFGRAAFFRTVALELNRTGREVGRIVASVLAAVREQLSGTEAEKIGNQLPTDLKILWGSSGHETRQARVHGEARRRMKRERRDARRDNTYHIFLRDLSRASGLDEDVAESAAVSVLGELRQRLTPTEAKDLDAQLPSRLVGFLPPADGVPGELPRKFDAEGLFLRVAEDLEMEPAEAVPLVHFVFQTVRLHISAGEAEDVGAQLPADIAWLWDTANDVE